MSLISLPLRLNPRLNPQMNVNRAVGHTHCSRGRMLCEADPVGRGVNIVGESTADAEKTRLHL